MKSHAKRLIVASLVTPWIVVPVTGIFAAWYYISWIGKSLPDPGVTLMWPHPFKPWETVFLYSLYGVPTAYLSLLFIGLPCYFIARKLGLLSFTTAICVGIIACIPAAALFGQYYNFWPTFLLLLCFGIPLSVTFALIANEKIRTGAST